MRQDLIGETADDGIFAPARRLRQCGHGGAGFPALAHALEGLVVLIFQQRIETRNLRWFVEQIAAEDSHQTRLGHERRQRQEHEMAFRTDPAPTLGGTLTQDMEIAVAAGEMRVVEIGLGKLASHGQLRERTQQRIVIQIGGDMTAHMRGEAAFEIPAFRPLVIDLTGALNQAAVTGRTFIGEHHLIGALQQRGQSQDGGIDRGHRDVAIQRALLVHGEQFRRQLAADVQQRQSGTFGAGADQRRRTDPGHGLRDTGAAQGFNRHQGILAAADGDQGLCVQTGRRRAHRRWRIGRKDDLATQVQSIAIGEFTQAVFIDFGQEGGGAGIDGVGIEHEGFRYGGFVVADPGNQVQGAQRRLHGGSTRRI